MKTFIDTTDIIPPHKGGPVISVGTSIESAKSALIMIHGRGASAKNILMLADEITASGMTFLAPQAAGGTWYPYRFIEPVERNEPGISSGLQMIDLIYSHLKKGGLGDSGIFLLGFSQGACLALEYAARNPRNYGGVFGLSGGLIGDSVFRERYSGSFNKIPVFLGCSDKDPHIPLGRVEETAKIFKSLGAVVEMRIYQGMGHTVNLDEIKFINETISEKTIV